MKRIIAIVLAVLTVILSAGCSGSSRKGGNGNDSNGFKTSEAKDMSGTASSGLWISFSELNGMLKSADGFEKEFDTAINNCKSLSIENLYIHVRSYSDSLFPSDYFPLIDEAKGYNFDVFKYIVDKCHDNGIKVHAWINPYRVTTTSSDVSALDQTSPAYKWLNDDDTANDDNVCIYNGIYLNPAKSDVRELVINGIREILNKYDVDGIHFDDYFYPTTDSAFDATTYEAYKSSTQNPLSVDNWRRSNVNALISGCYTAIKYINKDVIFSVSPMANIQKNYTELYADVDSWIVDGCIDYIIPQLYFGFEYPDDKFKFDNLLKEWKSLASKNNDVGLEIGLGPYKIGIQSEHDKEEWNSSTDIIAHQAKICKEDSRVSGYILFSYTSMFSGDELNTKQRTNLEDFIKSK